jgi:hypothetical protein
MRSCECLTRAIGGEAGERASADTEEGEVLYAAPRCYRDTFESDRLYKTM